MDNVILEVRGLTPKETRELEPVLAKVKDIDQKPQEEQEKIMEEVMGVFFDKVYPGKREELFPAEQLAVYVETLNITGQIRYDRIKNLSRQSVGSLNGQITAKGAEN